MSVSVAQVMSDRVVAVRREARFSDIVGAMRRFGISSVPVIADDERVIGIVSEDDLLAMEIGGGRGLMGLLGRFHRRPHASEATAAELMSTPAVTVTADTPAREAARAMYRHRIRRLPVVDGVTGRLTGIVTRSDLLAVYERPDEDIRHEILYDIIEGTLRMNPSGFGVTVAHGTVTIRGDAGRRSEAVRLVDAIGHVEGVLAVDDQLTGHREPDRHAHP